MVDSTVQILRYYWLCFREWLLTQWLKIDHLVLLRLVTDYIEDYHCSFRDAAKQLCLCEEEVQLCAQILTLQTTTLADAMDTYLRQQNDTL